MMMHIKGTKVSIVYFCEMEIDYNEACFLLRKRIDSVSKISDDDWALLLPHLEYRTLRKTEFFIQEGKKALHVGFVIEGMLRQFYSKDGDDKTTYFFFENDFISSYISCITGKPSLVSIEALSDSGIIFFTYNKLSELFDKSMAWQKFGRLIAEYLTMGLEERMVSLLIQSPEERYLDLLSGTKKKIISRVPQQYIANYLGITPVSMSRLRNRLSKK